MQGEQGYQKGLYWMFSERPTEKPMPEQFLIEPHLSPDQLVPLRVEETTLETVGFGGGEMAGCVAV